MRGANFIRTDDVPGDRPGRAAAAAAQENAKALNAAMLFEIDDVIDPAETRAVIAATLAAADTGTKKPAPDRSRFIDTW
uniref:Uncharacterized protein n=1 Tax=Mycolicibacterium gilvum (strain PYR-GCK) TaxID=350054 RepID=A4T4Y3_MYCGI|nr:hypothetical protein Mflv_0779 [Mycolicibacterium gilvum PYR-GCK]